MWPRALLQNDIQSFASCYKQYVQIVKLMHINNLYAFYIQKDFFILKRICFYHDYFLYLWKKNKPKII